jgi:electron transfer flavoprotein beta subunit
MNLLVLLRMVADVVEELEIAPDGKSLDRDLLRMIPSEWDEFALEQALLLKERYGGKVTVAALEAPEVDDALYTALARGADRAVKITGLEPGAPTSVAAELLGRLLADGHGLMPADLILAGTQAIDDLDGLLAPILAVRLDLPYVGIVTRVVVEDGRARVTREYPRGVRGDFEVRLPAILGVQSAEKPPRYVPLSKVRAVMKSQQIETVEAPEVEPAAAVALTELVKPVAAGQAEMLEGGPEEVARKIVALLSERGLV